MRAITVRQPWASLIAEGVKTIETRARCSPWSSAIGETVAIHAAKRLPLDAVAVGQFSVYAQADRTRLLDTRERPPVTDRWIELPLGAIVATARIADVVPIGDRWGLAHERAKDGARGRAVMRRDHRIFGGDTDGLWIISSDGGRGDVDGYAEEQIPLGDFTPGGWAVFLEDVRKTAPAPCRGAQGLWTVPADVADNLLGWAA